MAKSYLKYEQELTFGIVTSCNNIQVCGNHCHSSNVNSLISSSQWHAHQPVALAAAGERLIAWNVKSQTQLFVLGGQAETSVTAFKALPTLDLVVAGHSDGCVRVWKREDAELLCVLEGHSSSVLSVALGLEGALAGRFSRKKTCASSLILRAVTGAADTDIIVWDLVSHTGLFKLRGHTDAVTHVAFIDDCARIVSCSKDGSVKVWDVGQQRCVQTLPGHRGEVWSLDCNDRWMVSGGKDADLRVWQRVSSLEDSAVAASEDVFEFFGTVTRASSNDRVAHIKFNAAGTVLMCQTADRCVQLLPLRNADQAKDKRMRRQKRLREKNSSKASGENKVDTEALQHQASDWFSSGVLLTCAGNVKCADIRGGSASDANNLQGVQVLVARSNGSIEVHESEPDGTVLRQLYTMSIPANSSDVRCLEFSSDQRSILSCSGSELKVWSATSGACTATISSGPAVAASWLPGDRYAVAGLKSGGLRVVDVSTCDVVQEIEAHAGTCWTICMDKKNNRFVTGGSDKKIRFWQISPSSPEELVAPSDVIEVADAVLSVRYSPKMKFLAACLLDCTVRIYHADTMTFFLSLYGHRLPVLCCSMSTDETLIVTGSADKNVKIWGLDFGDCQKSMFAHGDSVMSVQFVPNTHYFFSSGKDGIVKFWDADIRECVMTFNHHHAEVLALAVSRDGETMCSGSRDRSIRVYVRGDEQVFLEEQRQLALEKDLDAQELKSFESGAVMGDTKQIESARVSRLTKDTVEASERLVEMIELLEHEDKRRHEHAVSVSSALAQGLLDHFQ
jgi:U3 small nucleolar RNA-associated protein 12